jgi:hypothetical protein
MENFALYFHLPDYDGIVARAKAAFPKAQPRLSEEEGSRNLVIETGGGLFSRKQKLTLRYRQRANPSYKLDMAACPLTRQLLGMRNYVASLPASDKELQSLLLRKIETINAELIFIAEPKLSPDLTDLLQEIARAYDAFLFVQPGSAISQSPVQHFLDQSFHLIQDIQGKSGNGSVTVQIDTAYFDDQRPATPEQVDRKQHTEKLLAAEGVLINPHLPYTEPAEEVVIRTEQEIINRAYALTLIAAKGEGVPMDQLEKAKEELAIGELSPYEQHIYAKQELTDQEKANATWRYESLNVLLWVLGFIEQPAYPSLICDVPRIVEVVIRQSRESFESRVHVKSKAEILDELDKAYRMHWACVQARITNAQPSGSLIDGVVFERHYVLNWLTCYQDQAWDDVSTDT